MINSIVNTGYQSAVASRDSGSTSADHQVSGQNSSTSATTSQPDAKQLNAAVSKLNDYVQNSQRSLSFSVDKATGRTVIKVYDSQTNELIRQLPPDETLKLAASIDEQLAKNLFVKERA